MDSKEEKQIVAPTWKTNIESEGKYLYCIADAAVKFDENSPDNLTRIWVFHPLQINLFNIINAGGANEQKTFLQIAGDGGSTTVGEKDDGSGRQQWTLQKVTAGPYAGLHRIKNVRGVTGNNHVLGIRVPGWVKLVPTDNNDASQMWKMKIPVVSVSFDLGNGVIQGSTPQVVAEQTLSNSTSINQSMSFQLAEKVEETSTFENSVGVSMMIGAEFECGLPFVGSGKISAELTTSFTHTWGKTETFSTEITATFPLVSPPNKKIVCKAVVTKSKLNVPYTFTFADGTEETGTWIGVSAWDLRDEVEEYALDEIKE